MYKRAKKALCHSKRIGACHSGQPDIHWTRKAYATYDSEGIGVHPFKR